MRQPETAVEPWHRSQPARFLRVLTQRKPDTLDATHNLRLGSIAKTAWTMSSSYSYTLLAFRIGRHDFAVTVAAVTSFLLHWRQP